MKFYFIFLNVLLFLMIGGIVFLHVRHTPPPSDAVLEQTPEKVNIQTASIWDIPHPDIRDISIISRKNLFEPRRGEPLPPPPKVKELDDRQKKLIELVGICKIGDFRCAVIKNKNLSRRKYVSRGKTGIKRPPIKKIKSYYREGEKLENGYIVKAIHFDSVVLSAGKDEFVLKLDRKDSGSASRIKSVKITSAIPGAVTHKTLPPPKPTPVKRNIRTDRTNKKPKVPRFFRRRRKKR